MMNRPLSFTAVLAAYAFALPAGATAGASPLDAQTVAQVDSTVNGVLSATHVPSASVAVVRDGTVILQKAYGYANVVDKTPARIDTRYEIGSITKQFTATAILQLKEQGKVKLDDPLGRWIPEYAKARGVTLRQLLDQTSGIPDYTERKDFEHIAGTQQPSFAKILALVDKLPLDFKPGTKWEYSDTNYILLGEVIARAAHQSWANYVRAHIFAPAGMTESGFIADEARLTPMATGYVVKKEGVAKIAPALLDGWAGAAGAIVSTSGDMVKWDLALFRGGLIDQTDLTLMMSPNARIAKGMAYGYGWVVDTADGHERVWHNGGTFGFLAANVIFPRDRTITIALLNADAAAVPETVATRIFEDVNPK